MFYQLRKLTVEGCQYRSIHQELMRDLLRLSTSTYSQVSSTIKAFISFLLFVFFYFLYGKKNIYNTLAIMHHKSQKTFVLNTTIIQYNNIITETFYYLPGAQQSSKCVVHCTGNLQFLLQRSDPPCPTVSQPGQQQCHTAAVQSMTVLSGCIVLYDIETLRN